MWVENEVPEGGKPVWYWQKVKPEEQTAVERGVLCLSEMPPNMPRVQCLLDTAFIFKYIPETTTLEAGCLFKRKG